MALVDIALFQPTTPGQDYLQDLISPVSGSRTIFGPEKLAQRFIMVLLTPIGSIKYDPTRGTDFARRLLGNNFISEIAALGAFAQGQAQARVTIKNDETPTMPDNEKFLSADVVSITISSTVTTATIQVNNVAGTSINLTIPLAFGNSN